MHKGSPAPSLHTNDFALSAALRQQFIDLFDQLKRTSLDGVGVSRETYGASETAAFELIERHAQDAGLETAWDPARNLIVRLPGKEPSLPSVATGSHLDSVPEGGNFDGAAGVVAGLAALMDAKQRGNTARDLVLYALRGEESAWFGGPCYFGSRALFGGLMVEDFASLHRSGHKTLEDSMRETGTDIDFLKSGQQILDPARLACWFELHIEQGPVLIAREKPVGLVTGIRGNIRHRRIVCRGEAAHSGAVPRWLRHDAVLAMSDLLVRIDEHWRILLEWGEDLVVTAGVVETNPAEHAVSRVPGEVTFALEYRSQEPKTLDSFGALLQSECEQVGEKRGVTFDLGPPSATAPAEMSPNIVDLLEGICTECGTDYEIMPSGAGHDSSVFANAGVPSGMIFVRNDKGSHNPHEAMDFDDFFQATEILNGAMQTAARDRKEYRS
ncbi:MAG: Zn-dependent hydrolase [Pseudomonadota bacterium]|nr:Zn-dependent hydrolase [Pseudomonadota bacterium]